jgi:hypothetical protein
MRLAAIIRLAIVVVASAIASAAVRAESVYQKNGSVFAEIGVSTTGIYTDPVYFLCGNTLNTDGPLTCAWNFGDGQTAENTLSPSHRYAQPGTYTASVTVADYPCRRSHAHVAKTRAGPLIERSCAGNLLLIPNQHLRYRCEYTNADTVIRVAPRRSDDQRE